MVRMIVTLYSKYLSLFESHSSHPKGPQMIVRGVSSQQLLRPLIVHIFELNRHKVRFSVIWRGKSGSSSSPNMLLFAKELLSRVKLLVTMDYLGCFTWRSASTCSFVFLGCGKTPIFINFSFRLIASANACREEFRR